MKNTNWAHLISPEDYEPTHGSMHHLEAVQFRNSDEMFVAVDRAMNVILQKAAGLDRGRIKALEWSLNEISDNVLNHSESPFGGFMQVVTHRQDRKVEFFISDAGIGIPRSLRSGRPDLIEDVRALRSAIDEGVTRNSKTNQGNGLYGTFKCCEVSGGEFNIYSGNVSLSYSVKGLSVSKNVIPFRGTFVRACISYDFEELLERALIFRGKRFEPGHDFIEREYQPDSDIIQFNVKHELEAFGSREAGKFAKTKIENLMDKYTTPIMFDFIGLNLISSSFADEVFGRIFVEIGPINFARLCNFKNIHPTVRSLIDRAIQQRVAQNNFILKDLR